MKSYVIFGTHTLASVTASHLRNQHGLTLAGFTVDDEYYSQSEFEGLPVVRFTELGKMFSPEKHELILPLGYSQMNSLRGQRLVQAKDKGFTIGHYVSEHACVLSDTHIGENLLIFEQAIVQPYVKLGGNIILRAGANIGHHSVIDDHSFIASNVVTGGNVTIGKRCFIGLGAVIRDDVKIADRCFIGVGAVVVKDTEPDGVYVGNPARRIDKTPLEVTS